MTRIIKSLTAPENGHRHREHRSKKGRNKGIKGKGSWTMRSKFKHRKEKKMGDRADNQMKLYKRHGN